MTDALVIGITGFLNLLLGGFVIMRNPKNPIHRLFAAFSISIIIWSTFNFLADQATSNNLLYTRLTFAGAVLIALSLLQLSNVFPTGRALMRSSVLRAEVIIAVLVFLFSLTPLLVPSVVRKPGGGVELEVGPLYALYILYVVHILVYLTHNFRRQIKKSGIIEKLQIRLLLTGIVLYALFAIASNLVLPLLIDSWSSSRYGPVFTLLFVAFTAYAIIRHRLLDIRLIVARSVGYILALIFLGGVYGVAVFVILEGFILGSNELGVTERRFVYTTLALVFGLSFAPAKRKFDKLSNRLFYRDAYDAQFLLDQLNTILVSTINIEKMLKQSAQLIEANLKAEFCMFGIKETSYAKRRVIGVGGKTFSDEDIALVREETPKIHERVIVVEELPVSLRHLASRLKKYNIAILARLVTDVQNDQEGVGYLVLGAKKSGNPYNKQDLNIIEIIASELVIAIQNAMRVEEIERFNITLQHEIDDATGELKRTNEKLKALDETKDEFISMASHQLRTPLTSVKGYLSMVLEGDAGKLNDQQMKLLNQAFISSQRMVYLISDLLNVSRLRTGKFIIESAPTNLPEVIEGEMGQVYETAEAKGLKLTFEKPEEFPILKLDETKLRQVIMNFIDNAIYYTPAGGHIRIELEELPKTVEFRVIDDGLGVPKAEQHHLFSKFYRAENAKRARPDGTGLGLFMAKKVIIAQGGAIIFKSTEGKGSTFGFTFPRHKLETAAK